MEVVVIQPRELEHLCGSGKGVDLIDVRTPAEFREMHVPFARNIPLSDLDPAVLIGGRTGRAEDPIYVICRSGARGKQACEKILAAGIANVVNVEGGTLAWAECGLPVVRGRKAISIERQVRISIGILVVLGTILAWWVHSIFLLLAGAVGLGVLYSGITDSCAMGMMLSYLPWNRAPRTKAPIPGSQCAPCSSPVAVGP